MTIGDRIRAARKAAELSQEEVARRAGLSLKGMGDIERGDIEDPHFSSLVKIAHALDVPVEVLIREEEPAVPLADASETGPEELQLPSLDQVRAAFAPLAEGVHHYCARWEEKIPNLQGTHEEVADFFFGFINFRAIIMHVLEEELYAIAEALDLGNRYGESGLSRERAVENIRAQAGEHSLMQEALDRCLAVGEALAESLEDKEVAEGVRQVLARIGG